MPCAVLYKNFLILREFYLSFMYTFCKCFLTNRKTVLNVLLLFPCWYEKDTEGGWPTLSTARPISK